MITLGEAAMEERIDSERNQGRAPDMGWLDHDRLGFNYRLSDLACALGIAQLGTPGRNARRSRTRRGLLQRGSG
jgi:dTDP-4-amino-4,6-dideoxygalactose transaminase